MNLEKKVLYRWCFGFYMVFIFVFFDKVEEDLQLDKDEVHSNITNYFLHRNSTDMNIFKDFKVRILFVVDVDFASKVKNLINILIAILKVYHAN